MINTPKEIVDLAIETGCRKTNYSTRKTLVLAILSGIYIAMGGAFSLTLGYGFPEITAANPALQKMLSGMVFPIGLILIVFTGAELFTGNSAVLIPGLVDKRFSFGKVAKNWFWVYVGNFIGALFFTWAMVYATGIMSVEPWHSAVMKMAETKTSLPWFTVFMRGIGANWLVCLAVWLGMACKTPTGKMIGLWFPVFCFVAMGFEHSIANMFFIPLGMMEGAQVTTSEFLINNLVPSTLGNLVGGAVFVGGAYTLADKIK